MAGIQAASPLGRGALLYAHIISIFRSRHAPRRRVTIGHGVWWGPRFMETADGLADAPLYITNVLCSVAHWLLHSFHSVLTTLKTRGSVHPVSTAATVALYELTRSFSSRNIRRDLCKRVAGVH